MSARALPVLMYHHVSPAPGLVTISPQNFAAQIAWLANNGYRTASCHDLERFIEGHALPARSVMITFDDGYLDNYVHAYPVLREHGLHAVVFAVTDWIGDGEPRALAGESATPRLLDHRECGERIRAGQPDEAIMRWSEVRRTLADGVFELHSHTASHTRWDQKCADADAKSAALAQDLARSRLTLQQRLGAASAHLCWPQGYFDADYQAVARTHGYTYLYTTRPGTIARGADTDSLPRIVVKDRGADWLASRLRVYTSPRLARWYGWLKGV